MLWQWDRKLKLEWLVVVLGLMYVVEQNSTIGAQHTPVDGGIGDGGFHPGRGQVHKRIVIWAKENFMGT